MGKVEEAKEFLAEVGMPEEQQTNICSYTLLAVAGIKPTMNWNDATNEWIRIHDIIQFSNKYYETSYKENSRETFRKQALHHFLTAALVETNGRATNSPNYKYRLTEEALELLKNFYSPNWGGALTRFLAHHDTLVDKYASKRKMAMHSVKINGDLKKLSPGKHNDLQRAVIEEFAPRFAPNSECLYLGDTTKKDLIKDVKKLDDLGFEITLHDKMPDIVLYREDKDWIFFIEAVTSVGPMSPARVLEIKNMTKDVKSEKIFVTAFLDSATCRKFIGDIDWETEIWIAESPEHMIHMNGDKFLGPRK